jgi:hypothetical protein
VEKMKLTKKQKMILLKKLVKGFKTLLQSIYATLIIIAFMWLLGVVVEQITLGTTIGVIMLIVLLATVSVALYKLVTE